MALNQIQQLGQLINDSHYILVVFSHDQDIDAICSALCWKYWLEKKYKQIDVVCENFANHKNLKFLKGLDQIKPQLGGAQKFTIKVDVSNAKIDSLSYDIKDGILSIYLNPKQGTITKNELRTAQSSFKYDLIITINTPDLESLGPVFNNNTDLFYRLTVVNFDHDISNERYGQVNFVEPNSTATSENIFKIIKQMDETLIDPEMATALLAGIISQTRSFKTDNITPYTLNTAGELMRLGADREKIIKHLYHNRSISSLKIWGQALTHLQSDEKIGLVWTTITRDDLVRSGASANELSEVIEELIINSPQAKVVLLLYEKTITADQNQICGLLVANSNQDARALAQPFHPLGDKKKASFILEKRTLKQAEEEVLDHLKKQLASN